MTKAAQHLRIIRTWLTIFILGLILSGVTAFPLQHELDLTLRLCNQIHLAQIAPALSAWLVRVDAALADENARYPFLAYGTDWLAFGHIIIALFFIAPWLNPVRNKAILIIGLIACAGVIPLAFIAGPIRGIPFYWRCIDSSFGIFGAVPLLICLRHIRALERPRD